MDVLFLLTGKRKRPIFIPMKLYFPKSHYHKSRPWLFPLLRPFIKGDSFTDAQRVDLYGVSERDFEFTDTIEDADLAILTMAWNYYIEAKQTDLAISFINECDALGKKVLVVNTGDYGLKMPIAENMLVLRFAGYKSKFSQNEYVYPPFLKDPLIAYFDRERIIERTYFPKAVIGFCGQANSNLINATKEIIRTGLRNMRYYLGVSIQEPQQLLSTTLLRARVLNNLQKSTKVTSNFILRKKYRAGVTAKKDTHQTTLEFYNNLKDSDYIVCVRGAGNFSIRFYEALAMGRIPVFINTDCALPFDDELDWKKHVVWVEYKERSRVAEIVAEFHNALSERDFIDLQYSNRKLWEDRLTLGGFFENFLDRNIPNSALKT